MFGDEDLTCKDVCPVEKTISERLPICHHEGKLKTRSGNVKDMQVSISPLYEGEDITGAVVVMEDITRLRNVEETNVKTLIVLEREIETRKKVEFALRESEVRYRKVVEDQTELICRWKPDTTLTFVNDVFCRFFGMTRKKLIGQKLLSLLPSKNHQGVLAHIASLDSESPFSDYEHSITDTDGRILWLQWKTRIIYGDNGDVSEYQTVGRDLSDFKHVQELLQVREHQQKEVSQLGQFALSGLSLSSLFDEAVTSIAQTLNVEYCKILELLPAGNKLLLRSGIGWKHGLVGSATVSVAKNSQAGYTLISNEPVIVDDLRTEKRFSGPSLLLEHDVVSGLSVIIGDIEEPFGVLGAHTTRQIKFTTDDINFLQNMANLLAIAIERKQADMQIIKAKKEWEQTFDAAPDLISIIDNNHRIVRVNKAMADRLGITPNEAVGLICYEQVHGTNKPPAFCPHVEQLQVGGKESSIELFDERLGGSFLITVSPFYDDNGQLAGGVHIARDINETKQAL